MQLSLVSAMLLLWCRINLCLLLKVRWLPALEKEEGPNANSSNNRRELRQERRREPAGRTPRAKVMPHSCIAMSVKKKIPQKLSSPLSITLATHCSQPRGCPPMATHSSTPSTRTATATSWPSRILTLRTRRSWSWTAGQANQSPVTCTGPVCMRGCCWPCMTEVRLACTCFPPGCGTVYELD